MSNVRNFRLIDEAGAPYGVKHIQYKPRVSSMDYLFDMAEGNITDHHVWSKIGYALMPATTETDLYSYGGTVPIVPLMTGAATRRVKTANAGDEGVVIKGDATTDTITSTGGSLTSLSDTGNGATYFQDATAVAAGDCVILDPHGTSPEWGYVTGVGAQTLTIANGFSHGGSGASRKYAVVDYSPQAGCHAVCVSYLDTAYATKREIVVTNGNVANGVLTINADYFRVNSFRVIATGSSGKATGAVLLGDNATPPTIIYTFITAGFTRGRNSIYTVPANKTLYITEFVPGFGANASNKNDYCRIYLRAAQYTNEQGTAAFRTNVTDGVVIWYPYHEAVMGLNSPYIPLRAPIKILPKVSIKVSGSASGAGAATVALRGWLE